MSGISWGGFWRWWWAALRRTGGRGPLPPPRSAASARGGAVPPDQGGGGGGGPVSSHSAEIQRQRHRASFVGRSVESLWRTQENLAVVSVLEGIVMCARKQEEAAERAKQRVRLPAFARPC
jgi:hypothetical protein